MKRDLLKVGQAEYKLYYTKLLEIKWLVMENVIFLYLMIKEFYLKKYKLLIL